MVLECLHVHSTEATVSVSGAIDLSSFIIPFVFFVGAMSEIEKAAPGQRMITVSSACPRGAIGKTIQIVMPTSWLDTPNR